MTCELASERSSASPSRPATCRTTLSRSHRLRVRSPEISWRCRSTASSPARPLSWPAPATLWRILRPWTPSSSSRSAAYHDRMPFDELHTWELWYPGAGATGLPLARARIDPHEVVWAHAVPRKVAVTVRQGDDGVVARGE